MHTTACNKPSKRSIFELGIQMTIRVTTLLLPLVMVALPRQRTRGCEYLSLHATRNAQLCSQTTLVMPCH